MSIIASACAGGLDHVQIGAPLATWGAPSLLSSRLVAPSVLSKVYAPTVLSGVAHEQVTVAHHGAVPVEKVSVGSVPSLSVVNEPTTIVTPGKPIRGHSFTSEVNITKYLEKTEVFVVEGETRQHRKSCPTLCLSESLNCC